MKNALIFLLQFAALIFFIFWFTDRTIDCDKIPKGERYKYAIISIDSNKCVKMSENEIKDSLIEEQEEKIEELQEKLLYTEAERDWAINEIEENDL